MNVTLIYLNLNRTWERIIDDFWLPVPPILSLERIK